MVTVDLSSVVSYCACAPIFSRFLLRMCSDVYQGVFTKIIIAVDQYCRTQLIQLNTRELHNNN
jgi:hypothetical protein